jgi:hypothetical protein
MKENTKLKDEILFLVVDLILDGGLSDEDEETLLQAYNLIENIKV